MQRGAPLLPGRFHRIAVLLTPDTSSSSSGTFDPPPGPSPWDLPPHPFTRSGIRPGELEEEFVEEKHISEDEDVCLHNDKQGV